MEPGVNNFMIYGTGDIPVVDYERKRLVNLRLAHRAIDGSLGYTYLNPASGLKFSAVAGLTYNFIGTMDTTTASTPTSTWAPHTSSTIRSTSVSSATCSSR
jgi:hypothetical protein